MEAFMCSAAGDVFFEAPDRSIHWLDTGQGQLAQVSDTRDLFLAALRDDAGAEWFLAPVVDQLLAEGKLLAEGQCFAFKVLPILGGTYAAENMVPMSAAEWYGFSGHVHHQIKDLPEGTSMSFKISDA
ncbi:T6SS immunity protein Tdi1 domain-containing protein [Caldimonas brevitalea]|uniref:T6SS immunity protein Tdi1 domain-containing protein n=1 Tax=Caldimonas brevitalea TaxID=413882 RepID=UPI0014702CF4|nr:T6SS immunity protein Tdi1 domain-containing protein [Caldimonas brevitalea]